MASILAFTPREAASKRAAEDRRPATVIIFPGVRYERQPATQTADGATPWLQAGWMDRFQPLPQS